MVQTQMMFDVTIIGAGIAGLATAIALYQRNPTVKLALISPQTNQFASNQPGIASHPHFSKDHNLLSQWTAFCLPLNETALLNAAHSNADVALAKGRWQLAQSQSHGVELQQRAFVFNQNCSEKFHAHWRAEIGHFGALWLPSAWGIAPDVLRKVWLNQLLGLGCTFIDAEVTQIQTGKPIVVVYSSNDGANTFVSTQSVVICSPSALYHLVDQKQASLALTACLPLVQWPGQSSLEIDVEKSHQFGKAIVQTSSYAIPMQGKQWLVRDEHETARNAFRGDRWHTPDRLPYVGAMFDAHAIHEQALRFAKNDQLQLPALSNIFLNTAHGTRGLLSGIAGAAIIADLLLGENTSLPKTLKNAINPDRYIRRALRTYFSNLQSTS
jgi:glycine/D-amino acid oxidase-like deaminating enzyme